MTTEAISRYEQMLASDPASEAFVDLAAALVDERRYQEAIDACQKGLTHHPGSIVGRVLWGKSLIHLGKPAEAMEQFNQAMGIEKDNPQAHELISRVLLEKGLYRSAIPILRKALALRPADATFKRWLDQAQKALAGGPAPKLDEDLRQTAPTSPSAPPQAMSVPSPASPPVAAPEPSTVKSAEPPPVAVTPPLPKRAKPPPLAARPPPIQRKANAGLLGDIPELPDPLAESAKPTIEVPAIPEPAAPAIEELAARPGNGLKLALGAVALAAIVGAAGAYRLTLARHKGQGLSQKLSEAEHQIERDTTASYRASLSTLAEAVEMDPKSGRAWGLTAYARSILYAEHGGSPNDRKKAQEAIDKAGRSEPGLVLAARYHLSDSRGKEGLRKEVLSSIAPDAELQELAARLVLASRDVEGAVRRYTQALKRSAGNVRVLTGLGDYYRESGDCPKALEFYATAAQLEPGHPARTVGAAECRIELGVELDRSLSELEALGTPDDLPLDLLSRKDLVHGRLLTLLGQPDKAIRRLAPGVKGRVRQLEYTLALGDAQRAKGDLPAARRSYLSALELKPGNPEALDLFARASLAMDKEDELLSWLSAQKESRAVALERGRAYAKKNNWSKAREELEKTQVQGKFSPEAIPYLALADAAQGRIDRAQQVLEKAISASRRARSDLQLALGQIYSKAGQTQKAKAQFEQAAKDPFDYEAACSLGRMRLSVQDPSGSVPWLSRSVAKNGFHAEARHALVRALLATGEVSDALSVAKAALVTSGDGPAAQKDLALALRWSGQLKESKEAVDRSLKANGKDPESHRLASDLSFALGDSKSGFASLQRANKLDPKDPETFCAIGRAFRRQGRADAAIKAFEAALREDPTCACGKVGKALATLPAGAKSALKEMTGLSKSAPNAWDRADALAALSRAELATGEVQEAQGTAEQAVRMSPYSAEPRLALAAILLKRRDESKAKEQLLAAVRLSPTDGGAHLIYADVLARSASEAPAARAEYEAYLQVGADPGEQARAKKALLALRKKLAQRN